MKNLMLRTFWLLSTFCILCAARRRISLRNVKSFFTRKVCMGELGCFSAGPPFFHILERPLSLLPDDRQDINVHFNLFTQEYPNFSMNFSNLDWSIENLPRSGFRPGLPTKFIVPGYISRTAPHWKQPLKDALLFMEPCNVFYVDWSGGDGPLYEQAVANTRVVGAELALFIHQLQSRTGLTPDSVHIIGHSLGSHIAGYAGKIVKGLGRITAMDPAGPYFIHVDPVVRLDRKDALFVDAIHTNIAPSRFQGFGLGESIGHFDFFPNGGHLQPGCTEMGPGIWSFLNHPTIDADGLHDLMCNHGRAIDLLISSIKNGGECSLLGAACDSWGSFKEGRCHDCSHPSVDREPLCVPLGIRAGDFAKHVIEDKSINFYLNTTAKEPFCE